MNNYHYIIAGLPDLVPEFGSQQFSYNEISAAIRANLSKKDNKLVDWLEFGLQEDNLHHYFYHKAEHSKNNFLSQYFAFDRFLRNVQVSLLSRTLGKESEKYMMGEINTENDDYKEIAKIFEISNLIEREQALDRFRWRKISEINLYHYFDIDVILAFLLKGKIVERWIKLDQAKGAELFEQYVSEVRGTFTGINF
ncbi:MAG: DUF2764 family protein [Bacteroidales bacterium]|nr:DUF2764 family protein [Bacteroidales bacterium]MBO7320391.1 DUF2764 family protein [Bacteroidales bacterium]MBO7763683.1 DUF2764 family protein [Bacteroidales bacterium]MBQ2243501.1 DUF2764 family protein [Bacteroidales bacterium]